MNEPPTGPARVQPQAGRGSDRVLSLAPEAMAEGARRLGWLGLVYAIGNLVIGNAATNAVSALAGAEPHGFDVRDAFGFVSAAMGFGMFAVVRLGRLSAKRLLDLGLVFQVAGAFGIAVREFWFGLPHVLSGSFAPIPSECLWLVVYPLVVPNTPNRALVAALLAASMGPLGLAIAAMATGTHVARPLDVAIYFLASNYMSAILAYLVARMVHRSSVRLAEARAIGSYELIERIAAGGMGEVWRAHHRLLARPAAIKLIRGETFGENLQTRDALVRRFEREARDTAALRSTHTIDVYDFGLTEQGDFYYVMELLEGLTLERLVSEFGPVNPGRTVYLLRQVCHSLGEAHARGLIHRDVKPTNIFVCRLGPDDDFVKVLDFGLVKHSAGASTVTRLTMDGVITGTPGYIPPEIALGLAPVDGRADLYSLGCVAHYLLTGKPLFSADTAVAEVLAHVQKEPVPPSTRSKFHIPPALDSLILQCLSKDPAARPASAAEVSERLAATVPPDAWTPDAAHQWWERHRPLDRVRPSTHGEAAPGKVVRAPVVPALEPLRMDRSGDRWTTTRSHRKA